MQKNVAAPGTRLHSCEWRMTHPRVLFSAWWVSLRAFAKLSLLLAALLSVPAGVHAQAATVPPTAPSTPGEWRVAAREDVEAAYAIFASRHPGMFDPRNRSFPDQLRRARDTALAFTEQARDAEGHMRALALFSAGLGDGHARVQAAYSGTGELLWPGFSTVWRGDALRIRDPVQGGPPTGSVLLACDGVSARDLIGRRAFAFYGRPDEAGEWWVKAPSTFISAVSPYETLPSECSFRNPDGRTINHRLAWRPVPEAVVMSWFRDSETQPIGLTTPRSGIHLINLSSFSPDDEGRAAYARLFADLEAGAERIATGRAVVIDLRGNRGGSSSWSEQVAEKLWGKAAVRDASGSYFRRTSIWWLAHPANLAHFQTAAARLRKEGRAGTALEVEQAASGIEAALARGQRFYMDDFGARLRRGAATARPRRLPPVYVVTDGGCSSACLDAVDLFTRFPRVKLVGAPTSADSNYLEVMFEKLPSGRGGIIIPTKIWVNRPRGSGQVYEPDIPVNDLEWTTAGILEQIEQDLRRHRR